LPNDARLAVTAKIVSSPAQQTTAAIVLLGSRHIIVALF
jgi:hypothetical protein